MKILKALLAFALLSCGLQAQTQGFTNINVRGVGTIVTGGSLVLQTGTTFTIAGMTTNQLLYCNSSGNLVPLTLGSGLSISGGTLLAGSSTAANPTGTVGLSTVNGVLSSYMRSDAAPPLSQAIIPTWTGLHTFSVTAVKTSGTDYGMEILPTLNQRNATNFSLIYGNETVTQAGTGNQYFEEYAVGGTDAWRVTNTGVVSLATWNGVAVASGFGGTGLSTFPIGAILAASSANTWAALNPGTINYVLTSGGTGAATTYQPITTILDSLGSAAQGDILYRGASTWALLAPGTAGYALISNGAGSNPSYAALPTFPGTTVQHDVVSYSNTTGGLEDLGVLNITATTATMTANNGTSLFNITNTTASVPAVGITYLAPNLTNTFEAGFDFGVANSTRNLGSLYFQYNGSGSTSNKVSIGFYGVADSWTVDATGNTVNKTASLTGTTASSSVSTGTLILSGAGGGLGVAGQASLGNLVVFNGATAASVQGGLSVGNTAYSYGASSATGAAALLIPATTYTITTGTAANFQGTYLGIPTFTDATTATMSAGSTLTIAGSPVGAGSLTITSPYSLWIQSGLLYSQGTVYINPTFTNPITTDVFDVGTNSAQTSSSFSGQFIGGIFFAGVAPANTQNWTSGTAGLEGGNFTAQIQSGAVGTITKIIGGLFNASNGSAGATATTAVAGYFSVGNSGTLTNGIGLNVPAVAGTNSTEILIGSGAAPSGVFGFYQADTANDFFGGKFSAYNNITTSGWGVPAIYGTNNRAVGVVAAQAALYTYTVGAADGTFEVDGNVLVTTSTLHNFTMTVTYTDESNTLRTLTMTFSQISGTLITAITNVTGAGAYEGVPLHIRCKASTTITFATVGTFTTVAYNAEGIVKQEG